MSFLKKTLTRIIGKIIRKFNLDLSVDGGGGGGGVSMQDFGRINNPAYFDVFQTIYHQFKLQEDIAFSPVFQKRIKRKDVEILGWPYLQTGKKLIVVTDSDFVKAEYETISSNEIATIRNPEKYTFVLAFDKDWLGREAARECSKQGIKYNVLLHSHPCARYFHVDEHAFGTLEKLKEQYENEVYRSTTDFENIFQAINTTKDLPGSYVEIGVYKGNSAEAALCYMEKAGIYKKVFLLDTYEGFQYDAAKESEDSFWKDTIHHDTSIASVSAKLAKYQNASCKKCNVIEDELPSEIGSISLCNVDVDMYEAVKAAIYKVKDKIVPNGIIIIEDYGHTPTLLGAQKAVFEFLDENPNTFNSIYMTSGQMFLVKRG